MKKNVIVSLADANYFLLLQELIRSIKRFKESENIAICILDAGLTQSQKDELSEDVDEIKSAEWDIEVPGYKVKDKEWLKSQVSRAFLPKYFPNYQKYLWIDCDAWVNDWSSIELYLKACDDGKLGITQTIGPGYKITSKVNWLVGKLAIIKSQNFKHAVKSKIGYEKALSPIIDANVTTMIAAVILFFFGSGPIKGFSVTLGLGIITSVFTAFTVTRFMVARWIRKSNPKEISI